VIPLDGRVLGIAMHVLASFLGLNPARWNLGIKHDVPEIRKPLTNVRVLSYRGLGCCIGYWLLLPRSFSCEECLTD
jgi:hypothetical protein